MHTCMRVRLRKQRALPVLPITPSRCSHCGGEIAREPLTNGRCSSNECIPGADGPSSTPEWLQFQTPIILWGNEHPILQAPPALPNHPPPLNHLPLCCSIRTVLITVPRMQVLTLMSPGAFFLLLFFSHLHLFIWRSHQGKICVLCFFTARGAAAVLCQTYAKISRESNTSVFLFLLRVQKLQPAPFPKCDCCMLISLAPATFGCLNLPVTK